MFDKFKKEPALLIGFLSSVVAALAEVQQAGTSGGVWAAVKVALPLLAGILIRWQVVPVETLRTIVTFAGSAGRAGVEVADKVGVHIDDRPTGSL